MTVMLGAKFMDGQKNYHSPWGRHMNVSTKFYAKPDNSWRAISLKTKMSGLHSSLGIVQVLIP